MPFASLDGLPASQNFLEFALSVTGNIRLDTCIGAMRPGARGIAMKKEKGFSLVELLIVVGIILVISAIAIPNLIKAKIAANEGSAVASLRTILTGETAFSGACPSIGFTPNLADLSTATTCPSGNEQIDSQLASGKKSGYSFAISGVTGTPATTFVANADPLSTGSGKRHFYIDQTGVIHYNWSAPATSTDSALQ